MRMTWGDWIALGGMIATWAGSIIGVIIYFHKQSTSKRAVAIQESIERDLSLERKFETLAKSTREDHEAIKRQINDMALTFRDNYIHRRDFDQAIRGFHDVATEIRKDVGAIGQRIDRIFDHDGRFGRG